MAVLTTGTVDWQQKKWLHLAKAVPVDLLKPHGNLQ